MDIDRDSGFIPALQMSGQQAKQRLQSLYELAH
jgi:hypothetical protein